MVWSLAIDDHGNVASDHPLLYDEKQGSFNGKLIFQQVLCANYFSSE